MQFEKNLVLLRKKNNMSQEELAFAIDVSRQTIYSWESGLNYPNIVMLKKIADVLNVSTDDLLNGFEVNKLPVSFSDIKLTFVKPHVGEVKYEELPNWFIKLKPEEEICWALYDKKNGKYIRDYSYHIYTCGEAKIHDEDCVEIEVKEYDKELNFSRIYNQYISVKDGGVAWVGESFVKDGKRVIQTYKDKSFLKDWGYGEKFVYQKMNYSSAEDWTLEFNSKKQNVIKISYFDPDGRKDPEAAYFEAFLNEKFETLVWRRFTKDEFKFKDAWTDEEIVVNGNKYNMDYYVVTSRLK